MHQLFSNLRFVLFNDESSIAEVKCALHEYKTLLEEASIIDINEFNDQAHVHLDTGIAIGLKWAASCLDDSIRTQKFIRGTKRAIEDKLKGKGCVQVLYGGTGPFATLILPLLAHFSADQLKVTLLDVNPRSIKNVSQIIEHFGFQNHVEEIRCADATKTVFNNASVFDILLVETMQHALQDEQQLLISSRLLNQMPEDALLVPQSIYLDLIRLNSSGDNPIRELMKVDADFLRKHHPMNAKWCFESKIELDEKAYSEKDLLAIATKIHVYAEETIEWNESGLTSPKIVSPMTDIRNNKSIYSRYVLEPNPGFEIRYQ
ncbi:MAG: hypothetical protein P8P74_16120 [Crocinitomicaceae bacterium]|nr:hypothetical protein [Crocinitomicaceae bacterium]